MKKIIDYVRLTRPLNLLFIVVIQFLMARAVLFPLLKGFSIEEQLLPTPILILIVLATVLTAAGGYVINDYFDIKIDRINRPEKVIITTNIDKSGAMRFYQILTFVGTALGLLGAFLLRNTTLALLFVIVPGLLWFYSASYKRQFLIGNLAVAFCAALVPLTIIFAQNAFFELKYASLIYETPILKICYGWIVRTAPGSPPKNLHPRKMHLSEPSCIFLLGSGRYMTNPDYSFSFSRIMVTIDST